MERGLNTPSFIQQSYTEQSKHLKPSFLVRSCYFATKQQQRCPDCFVVVLPCLITLGKEK
jgi:hypothetical protein